MNTQQLKETIKDPAKMEDCLKQLFDALDKDHKGYLEVKEVIEGLKQKAVSLGFPIYNAPKEKKDAVIKVADPNNTGKVDFEGFKKSQLFVMEEQKKIIADPEKRHSQAKRTFEELDKEKKGYLSISTMEELEKRVDQIGVPILFKLNEEQKTKLKSIGDPNGTGKLTLEGCFAVVDAIAEKIKKEGLL